MTHWPHLSPFATGLAGRCPRCGRGALFTALLTVRERCAECGLDLRGHDAGDGPAVFVILGLGALLVPLVLWMEFRFDPPWWLHVVVWGPVTLAMTILPLRLIKGILVAQQYRHRSTAGGEDDR
ncbi:MAG: DUF983 domain-containing protein [Rhodospirillales bacterium]|nr:MAG: DUF983 domain-containing protein [Rhodospirillales bacterium]